MRAMAGPVSPLSCLKWHEDGSLSDHETAALVNRHRSRELIKEAVEDTGRHVVHELERFLNTLGTIAGISPLLGL